jgi:uncharacterized protein
MILCYINYLVMKQVIFFYILACLISWTIALPLVLPYFGIQSFQTFTYHHALVGLGPMLAAFISKAIFEGQKEICSLLKAMTAVGNLIVLLIALFSPFILVLIAGLLDYSLNGVAFNLSLIGQTKEFPHFNLAMYFIYNLIFFGFGEEVGWKGIVLPQLQKRWTALQASIIFTLFWAIWHLPLFFYRPGYVNMDLAGIIGWFFSLLTGSILMTWLFNTSKGSILVCAVFHATIDIAFVSDFANENIVGYVGGLITFWGVVIIFIYKPKHLSRSIRVTKLPG